MTDRLVVAVKRRVGLLAGMVGIISLGVGTLSAAPASATPPQHFRTSVTISGRDPFWSNACGFDVFTVDSGKIDVTLFYDQKAALTREVDSFPASKLSLTAPSTGKSIVTSTTVVLTTDYTGGGAVGTSAVATLTGLQYMIAPGVMAAGREVLDAVVVDVSPEGIPTIESTGVVSETGNLFQGDIVAAVCAILSGP